MCALMWLVGVAMFVLLAACSPHPPRIDGRFYSVRINPWCIVRCDAGDVSGIQVGDSDVDGDRDTNAEDR